MESKEVITAHTLIGVSRNQVEIPLCLDQRVSPNNPVRLIDLFVDQVIKASPSDFQWKGKSIKGRKAYPAALMLKIYVYCYLNSIRSSRRIETEITRNIELMWLTNQLCPNYWSLNEFRKDNLDSIEKMCIAFKRFLLKENFSSLDQVAIDGTKIKAYASPDVIRQEYVDKKIEKIETEIQAYLKSLDSEDSKEEQAAEKDVTELTEDLLDRIKTLETELKKYKEQKLLLEKYQKDVVAPNDPQSNVMKSRNGLKPCYNAQVATESKGHFIMAEFIATQENDVTLLEKDTDQVRNQTGEYPKVVIADAGYHSPEIIKKIEESENNIECIVSIPIKAIDKQDQLAGVSFTYDKDKDEYTCSQGQTLKKIHSNKKKGNALFDIYQSSGCQDCKLKQYCSKSKQGRSKQRSVIQDWIDQYETKMKRPENIELLKKRKTIVEHPFGTIKWMMGKLEFLLTGKHKVLIELRLLVLGYNIKRLLNTESVPSLLERMKNFDWKSVLINILPLWIVDNFLFDKIVAVLLTHIHQECHCSESGKFCFR